MISMAQRKTQFRSVSSTSCFTATPFDSNTWLLSSCDALICVPSAEEPVCQLQQQPTTSIWLQLHSDDERDHYYSREGSYNFEQDYHSRDNSWEREYHHWEQRHRDKEEAGKHKSWCKQHESKECENHKKNKHKKKEKS
ncbi:pre-mRNA 3'-end-processing factor FIP1-like isoform X7 [Podarcis raffonei]|uniref:pre-mRNA 3'-end-processing factor FIP1-like isoform X7 n=1 Tax=Podarcis raffonei TaxID=65483 RepID=UPI00232934A2|nr:pre-mRNA 3'-end-processing factor FIP1-like isoform X7 [Podarcis raffonei]